MGMASTVARSEFFGLGYHHPKTSLQAFFNRESGSSRQETNGTVPDTFFFEEVALEFCVFDTRFVVRCLLQIWIIGSFVLKGKNWLKLESKQNDN